MLLTHLVIGGLRAFGPEPTRVDLAALTLVFGPNSAGKSSLLSVLPVLQQSASRPETLRLDGELVDAGTFRMVVHNHDEETPITLGFGWRTADGGEHSGAGAFAWDPERRCAVRVRLTMDDGGGPAHVEGPRPWAGQPGAAVARGLAPEFYDVLSRIYFLGPMRARAERTTVVGGVDSQRYVGPAGEGMAGLLDDRPELVEQVNAWCDRLDMGYRVRMLAPVSRDIILSAGDFTVLALEDTRRDPAVLVSPRAVGYGVGQLLPVITQCCVASDGLVVVEQPEVHLHPRLQAAVGDVFVETVNAGGQVLVETHSEHLVLRLLRRVREGALDPDDLAILYVDMHDDGAAFVRRLEVDTDGELVDGWPGGFFDERLAEVLPGLR